MNSPSNGLQRLTKSRCLLIFLPKLRFALGEVGVLTRLPKSLTVLATLLLAILAVGAGAGSAAAHGNHSHQATTSSSRSVDLSRTEVDKLEAIEAAVSGDAELPVVPGEHRKSDCCCGSMVCHAGATLIINVLPLLPPNGARVTAELPSGHAQSDASGLERPPRTTNIA